MTKQDLVNAAANTAGITKKAAALALDAILAAITTNLKKGQNVTITGFGTFRVSKRAARTGVNPRNPSEKIKIPAMKVPAFKAGKSLKDAVR
ncbi:MAG: transcriptional dual regulator HU-alpha, DNA-binding protein HU-beta [Candidatus Peregrinibacteria bacterium GW2011_GWE2_39_6]|nr:MAG: transcriptional dual regulator HU-alpha, DNA-binding protein HU-beta [Candidatus Peregrinibacteria bacterium GW2011_GWF2_39_17]KKR25934.1 MAG: transcriptional dual regulator HU-alpha, DNA-binding protein HU-beta [Candidatus Peregrinibacteria bacterium GW2011_GWE2_39_6]HCW32367.1 DNA-binding protein HU [Candidatus Peregrinibacteria bacterium]